ncbi:hypothetical protein D9758_005350 [Tetrapyrgos nigripes]|uniref:Uncharacterized protein n=1 Tax=Tetrapyrgos nigripes TaxID=182062 RepID=A0A8H5GHZ6_9AGAR|nr:hypothetical protein D9758_005350 [Tetrapyrgos nigripes]
MCNISQSMYSFSFTIHHMSLLYRTIAIACTRGGCNQVFSWPPVVKQPRRCFRLITSSRKNDRSRLIVVLSSTMFNGLLQAFSNLLPSDDDNASDVESISDYQEIHTPSEDGVEAVREILLEFLPLELVDIILDTAEYWPCVYASQESRIIARNNEPWCYLITPPIPTSQSSNPDEKQRHRRVREIRFRLNSHDQGWGGEPEHQGTYDGSWTWFEALILRPSSPLHRQLVGNDVTEPFTLKSDHLSAMDAEQNGTPPQPKRWHIQTNVTASRATKEHKVIWTEEEKPVSEQRYDMFKGRVRRGHEVVRELEPGDRLAVLARAKFPGWENHVSGVSVEIMYFYW